MEASTKLRGRRTWTLTPSHWHPALLLVASFLGCGGVVGSGPPQPPPTNITVAVAPVAASLLLGESQTFTATVSNTSNTAVSWSVNGISGGNAAVGTIDAGGEYTAPQIQMAPRSVSLVATSVADPTKSGAASISVTSSFSLAVAGPSTITAGNAATYTATLAVPANSNPSRVISWSVAGTGCVGAACGTISPLGVYAAPPVPPSPQAVQIIATPQANPSQAASFSVSILPVIHISISPSAATVAPGSAQALQATVTGSQDATVTWDVNGVVGGNAAFGSILNSQTDPDNTTYSAPQTPPPGGSVIVRARSNADPGVSASATIGFTASIYLTITPAEVTLAISHRQTFSVQVNNTPNQNVTWLVNGLAGGSSAAGQICAVGSDPCQPLSLSSGGSVDYLAPAGVPSPDPVTITATSQTGGAQSASASATILPHIVVGVQPGSVTLAGTGLQRFTASVAGTDNQLVIWSTISAGCGDPGVCGFIDSTGLYTAPATAPSGGTIDIVATSSEDETQSGSATVTITSAPAIFSLAPASAYAGSAGGFTLLVSGNNFSASAPGPASAILVAGAPRPTSCLSNTQCITSLTPADLQLPGSLSVQLENPGGTLSNLQTFVVLAEGSGTGAIPLTPGAPSSTGNDIVVVELSTNGGSGAPGNVSLSIAAVGTYSAAASSCTLAGSPVVIQRPATGTGTGDLCVFSVSALDPSYTFTISGPPAPDITVINREPLGLGMLHLTLQVPAAATTGPRTLFVENPEKDKVAGTGAIEVR